MYTRQGLIELIKINVHSEAHAKGSGLTREDAQLLGGALTFKDRTVGQVMTPLDQIFSLPIDAVLDQATFLSILSRGHTREWASRAPAAPRSIATALSMAFSLARTAPTAGVPVYEDEPSNIVAVLLSKNLLGIGYERELPLREVLASFQVDADGTQRGFTVHRVPKAMKLNVALEICKRNRVHMLVVTEEAACDPLGAPVESEDSTFLPMASSSQRGGFGAAIGLATIEDFLEEILQEEIVDETDYYVDNAAVPETSIRKSGNADSRRSSSRDERLKAHNLQRLNTRQVDTTSVLRKLSLHGALTPRGGKHATIAPAPEC